MDSIDLIIVVIFLIIVVYVIQRAISTVEQQADTEFQKKELEQQLKEQTFGDRPLNEILDINFGVDPSRNQFNFDDPEKDKQPQSVIITVINKSENIDIYIDWDKSTISNYADPSRRVIRLRMDGKLGSTSLPPGSQLPSIVVPGSRLAARITVEDVLEVKADDKGEKFIQPKEPLLSFVSLQKVIKDKKKPKPVKDALKKQKKDFESRKPLEFSMRLRLRLADMSQGGAEYPYSFRCRFTVTRVRWANLLPWMPKK
ncbi:MAG: hypothetical protein Kow00121_68540 [Elainellaceae cyanobacterium]